jgi:hypothetical protein
VTTSLDSAVPASRYEPPRFWRAYLALGTFWWLVLLIPPLSRHELLRGWHTAPVLPGSSHGELSPTPADVLWGVVRVLAVTSVMCGLFRKMYRASPRVRWLSAALCSPLGCSLFALTTGRRGIDIAVINATVGVFVYFAHAWYVLIPMTALTAITLVDLERRASWLDGARSR